MGLEKILDWVKPFPKNEASMTEYILRHHDDISEIISRDPEKKAVLERSVHESFEHYHEYLGGIHNALQKVGKGLGFGADVYWASTGDIFTALGGKFLRIPLQIPDKLYGLKYAIETGNYLDAAMNIVRGAVSYIPGLTIVDEGLDRIIRERVVKDATEKFKKELGIYKPWTTKAYELVKGQGHTNVLDRRANVISPLQAAA